jgi:prolyl 4-hydroxylase
MAKWLHVGRYAVNKEPWQAIEQTEQPSPKVPEATECEDKDTKCDQWSNTGECHKNAVWMVGTPSKPGNCLASCMRCDVWKDHLQLQQGLQAGGVQTAGAAEQK